MWACLYHDTNHVLRILYKWSHFNRLLFQILFVNHWRMFHNSSSLHSYFWSTLCHAFRLSSSPHYKKRRLKNRNKFPFHLGGLAPILRHKCFRFSIYRYLYRVIYHRDINLCKYTLQVQCKALNLAFILCQIVLPYRNCQKNAKKYLQITFLQCWIQQRWNTFSI